MSEGGATWHWSVEVGSGAGTESKKTWAVDGKVSHVGRTPHWAQSVRASLASGEQRHCDGVWL